MESGNCLFRSMAHTLFETGEKHRDIQLTVINLIISDWEIFKELIIVDLSYYLPIKKYILHHSIK